MHQQNMLQDQIRTGTYYAAILENVADFQNKTIMDVGAGSGILSLFAAQVLSCNLAIALWRSCLATAADVKSALSTAVPSAAFGIETAQSLSCCKVHLTAETEAHFDLQITLTSVAQFKSLLLKLNV